jgi:hypothetical protein
VCTYCEDGVLSHSRILCGYKGPEGAWPGLASQRDRVPASLSLLLTTVLTPSDPRDLTQAALHSPGKFRPHLNHFTFF